MATGDRKQRGGSSRSSGSSGKRSTRVDPTTRTSSTSRSGGSKRGGVRDQTPPEGRRSSRATDELQRAVGGRESEFLGLGLIGVGVLLGLAIYLNLAGPLGRGVEALFGWIIGLGRFVLPVVLVSVGIALVRRGRSASPIRLAIGWTIMSLAALGLLHIGRFTDDASGFDKFADWGGWFGAAVGTPLEAALATAGSVVVLALVLLGGFMLVTQTSLRTMATQTGGFFNAVVRPMVRLAKSGLGNITTLSSDRDESDQMERRWHDEQASAARRVFDAEADDAADRSAIDARGVPGEALGSPTDGARLYDFE
ncbi:MAG: DNA translocase FtsK 4TM domain-containing protein, partial [Actinomycetota bacterium]